MLAKEKIAVLRTKYRHLSDGSKYGSSVAHALFDEFYTYIPMLLEMADLAALPADRRCGANLFVPGAQLGQGTNELCELRSGHKGWHFANGRSFR